MTGANKCLYSGGKESCQKHRMYAHPGEKAQFCSIHKKPGMVDVHNKRCEADGCQKHPTYGLVNGRARFCTKHKGSDMVDVHCRPCQFPGCGKHPHYAFEGDKARFCASHKETGMVDVKHKRCHTTGCREMRVYETPTKKSRFCMLHLEEWLSSKSSRRSSDRGVSGRTDNSAKRTTSTIYGSSNQTPSGRGGGGRNTTILKVETGEKGTPRRGSAMSFLDTPPHSGGVVAGVGVAAAGGGVGLGNPRGGMCGAGGRVLSKRGGVKRDAEEQRGMPPSSRQRMPTRDVLQRGEGNGVAAGLGPSADNRAACRQAGGLMKVELDSVSGGDFAKRSLSPHEASGGLMGGGAHEKLLDSINEPASNRLQRSFQLDRGKSAGPYHRGEAVATVGGGGGISGSPSGGANGLGGGTHGAGGIVGPSRSLRTNLSPGAEGEDMPHSQPESVFTSKTERWHTPSTNLFSAFPTSGASVAPRRRGRPEEGYGAHRTGGGDVGGRSEGIGGRSSYAISGGYPSEDQMQGPGPAPAAFPPPPLHFQGAAEEAHVPPARGHRRHASFDPNTDCFAHHFSLGSAGISGRSGGIFLQALTGGGETHGYSGPLAGLGSGGSFGGSFGGSSGRRHERGCSSGSVDLNVLAPVLADLRNSGGGSIGGTPYPTLPPARGGVHAANEHPTSPLPDASQNQPQHASVHNHHQQQQHHHQEQHRHSQQQQEQQHPREQYGESLPVVAEQGTPPHILSDDAASAPSPKKPLAGQDEEASFRGNHGGGGAGGGNGDSLERPKQEFAASQEYARFYGVMPSSSGPSAEQQQQHQRQENRQHIDDLDSSIRADSCGAIAGSRVSAHESPHSEALTTRNVGSHVDKGTIWIPHPAGMFSGSRRPYI